MSRERDRSVDGFVAAGARAGRLGAEVGDVLVDRVAHMARSARTWGRAASGSLLDAFAEYAAEESRLISGAASIRALGADIRALQEDVAALSARIDKLSKNDSSA